MCLHFEYVTNYLLRLTLRDLAEAFTLLRCCLGQTFFYRVALSFWLSLSDKGFPSQMWTQEKVKTHYADVCLWACTHVLIWVYAWTCGVGTLPTCPQYFSQLGRIHLFIIQQKTRGNYLNNLTTLMYFLKKICYCILIVLLYLNLSYQVNWCYIVYQGLSKDIQNVPLQCVCL